MNNFSNMKKAIAVFRKYGIPLMGKNKTAHFYQELKMDRAYVNGLIFELELELNKEIQEEKLLEITSPGQVLKELLKV